MPNMLPNMLCVCVCVCVCVCIYIHIYLGIQCTNCTYIMEICNTRFSLQKTVIAYNSDTVYIHDKFTRTETEV